MKPLLLCLTCLACLLALNSCQNAPAPSENSTASAPMTTPDTAASPSAAASTSAAGDTDWQKTLAHHNFVLTSYNGKEFSPQALNGEEKIPQPNFDFGQWPQAGGKICNNFSGQIEIKGNILTMNQAASTMMMCANQELDELERAFHSLLSQGAVIEFKDQTLTLKGSNSVFVYILSDYM